MNNNETASSRRALAVKKSRQNEQNVVGKHMRVLKYIRNVHSLSQLLPLIRTHAECASLDLLYADFRPTHHQSIRENMHDVQ